MVLATMLAMALVAASPAMADSFVVAGDVDDGFGDSAFDNDFDEDDVEFNAGAQNIIGSVGDITATQTGTATAEADNDSVAVARVHQSRDVSIEQVDAGFGDLDGDGILDEFEVFDGGLDDDGIFEEFE